MGLVSAYGSPEVSQLLGEFSDLIHSIRIAGDTITLARSRSLGEMESGHRIKLDRELRPALRAKHRELEERVAVELRGSAHR